jgi:hypothetical protein
MHGDGPLLATGGQKLPDIFHMRPRLVHRRQLLQRDQRRCQRFRDNPFVVAGNSLFRHFDSLVSGCSRPSTRSCNARMIVLSRTEGNAGRRWADRRAAQVR